MRFHSPILALLGGFLLSSSGALAIEERLDLLGNNRIFETKPQPQVDVDLDLLVRGRIFNPLPKVEPQPEPVEVEDVDLVGESKFDTSRPGLFINGGNNLVGLQQKDQYLTNTFTVGFVTSDVPEWVKKLLLTRPDGTTQYSIAAAHYIYTPHDLSVKEPQPNDRPYAGWLFVRLQSANRKDNVLIISGIDAGVVGPAAGAAQLQRFVHQLTGSRPPQGWDNQLDNELGVNIFHLRAKSWRKDGRIVDNEVVAYAGGTLGNINTHLQTGFLYRVGINVPDDMGAMYISPGDISGSNNGGVIGTAHGKKFGAYLFVGGEARVIARDKFLGSMEKEPFGLAGKAGFAIRYKDTEAGYVTTYARKQFKSQPELYTGFSGFFVRINRTF